MLAESRNIPCHLCGQVLHSRGRRRSDPRRVCMTHLQTKHPGLSSRERSVITDSMVRAQADVLWPSARP